MGFPLPGAEGQIGVSVRWGGGEGVLPSGSSLRPCGEGAFWSPSLCSCFKCCGHGHARPRVFIRTCIPQDPEAAWSTIFLLMAAVNVSSLLFYLVFAAADVQAWAQEKQLTRL